MSRRGYDANNLLAAGKLVTGRARPAAAPAPTKDAPAKKKTKDEDEDDSRKATVFLRTSPAFKQKLKVAAAERGLQIRELILAILKDAGFEE